MLNVRPGIKQRPQSATRSPEPPGAESGRELYLDLLARSLCRRLFARCLNPVAPPRGSFKAMAFAPLQKLLAARGLLLARSIELGQEVFEVSPPPVIREAETLIGPRGLENVRNCVVNVLDQDVSGDLIEAGVWRGGTAIFMRGVLKAYGDATRTVWAADSFQGLPVPDLTRHAADAGETHWSKNDWLGVSLEEVERNFARYGLLDDQVRFLVGWFHETLPSAPIEQLALIRLDGDMYGSTMDALRALYPRLSVGGYVIVDDYWLPKCRAAVDEYRTVHGITETLVSVDRAVVYWQRID